MPKQSRIILSGSVTLSRFKILLCWAVPLAREAQRKKKKWITVDQSKIFDVLEGEKSEKVALQKRE